MKIKKTGDLQSFEKAVRSNWHIKMSIWKETYILIVIRSILTGQTIVRHFNDETEAAIFVDFVCDLSAAEEHDI